MLIKSFCCHFILSWLIFCYQFLLESAFHFLLQKYISEGLYDQQFFIFLASVWPVKIYSVFSFCVVLLVWDVWTRCFSLFTCIPPPTHPPPTSHPKCEIAVMVGRLLELSICLKYVLLSACGRFGRRARRMQVSIPSWKVRRQLCCLLVPPRSLWTVEVIQFEFWWPVVS